MELVHHDVLNIQFSPFAERTVFQNFRSAAKDRSLHIHRRIARRKAHIFRTEFFTKRHPFFIHKRLDGTRVNGTASERKTHKMHRQSDHRLSTSRRRIQNHILIVEEFENRILLRLV